MWRVWGIGRGVVRAYPYAAGLIAVIGLTGCSDEEEILVVEPVATSVVTTFSDSAFDFGTLTTFAMPDTVVQFAPLLGRPIPVSRQHDQTALYKVRENLFERGYREVADPRSETPTFVVLVGSSATTNYNAWIGYPWYATWEFYRGWGWYAPGFTSAWTLVYPWYPVVGVTAYDRGTLVVDLIPTASVNPLARSIRSAWAGVASAVIDGAHSAATVENAIDRMFELSPYLQAPAPEQRQP
jgi:hypothetical protein